jgi:omega-6 fatty acid desaturase (delta-12 desaturase)
MRVGRELILATKEFVKEDKLISWIHLVMALVLLTISLAFSFLNINIFLRIICSLLSGFLMVRMFIIYHDFLHRTILQRSYPAKVVMYIYGILILSPPSIWKRTHDYHHKNNSKLFSASIGSYPIMTKSKFLSTTPRERFEYLAVRHPMTILFGYIFMFIYGLCIQSFIANPRLHKDSLLALIIHFSVIGLTLYFGGWLCLVLGIFVPFFISSAMGSYLFYAQHNFPGASFSNNQDWSYISAAMDSSSYMEMNPVMRWFTGNIGYHHIHHVNAHIPFYRLRETMRKIPEFQSAKRTSLSPIAIYHCLNLKVWDPETHQMMGLRKMRSKI